MHKEMIMNKTDKIQIKKLILDQIAELEKDVLRLEEATKPISPDNAYGRVSRMDAINNKAIFDAALIDVRSQLQSCKNALMKIDSNEYGKCVKCGNNIAIERLRSIPFADFCIICAANQG